MTQDIIIRSEAGKPMAEADNEAIRQMQALAQKATKSADGERQRIHLILRNQQLADILKRTPLSEALAEQVELYAYTEQDLWSMAMLGVQPGSTTRLDRLPITADSPQHVHLVIFGMSAQAESLAIHTALIAHYSNYCHDHALRTRITLVSDAQDDFLNFQQRYHNLLVHSYRRSVLTTDDDITCDTLSPKYQGQRDDFVDIEWEFVNGRSHDNNLLHKLQLWAQDEMQQLTLAFCYPDDQRNLCEALSLSPLHDTPIWVRTRDDTALQLVKQSGLHPGLTAFGMTSSTLPDMRRFIRMAQCISYAYRRMRETSDEEQARGLSPIAIATEIPTAADLSAVWNERSIPTQKLWSNIYHAFTLTTKMHSLGHADDEWQTLFAISEREVESLAEVEHNRWSVEELILGYRPTTDDEHRQILQNISLRGTLKQQLAHDDLRSYRELGCDETDRNVARYDVALIRTLPLIAHTFYEVETRNP